MLESSDEDCKAAIMEGFIEQLRTCWGPVRHWKSQQINRKSNEEPGGRLRLERTTSKIKISVDSLCIRMEGAEERISILEDITIQTIPSELRAKIEENTKATQGPVGL